MAEPSAEDVLRRISGVELGPDRAVSGYTELKADGSTACGCWIYSGVYADEVNQAARRKPHDQQHSTRRKWGWTWPMNRRVLYNRASADLEGQAVERAQEAHLVGRRERRVDRRRRPDFPKTTPRATCHRSGACGADGAARRRPVHHAGGREGLALRAARADRRPDAHALRAARVTGRKRALRPAGQPDPEGLRAADNPSNPAPPEAHAEVFPFVLTAARLTEHHTAGGMSRQLPYLSELQPELFVEGLPRAGP